MIKRVVLKRLKKACLTKKILQFLGRQKFSDKDYEHVIKVWNRFEMKAMKDCHEPYLECDVLLLADVFENV